MAHDREFEDLLREEAPQVLGALVRRFGHFDIAEDAVQEALLAAAHQWPHDGLPDNPRAWLVRVASRSMTDLLRSDSARRAREDRLSTMIPRDRYLGEPADADRSVDRDDSLVVLFMCCHPSLTPPSQISLTLRAVGGLSTEEIARAFLVPESTMAQRISRAKQTVKRSGAPFRLPAREEWTVRLGAVLRMLYLIFNEGYVATSGPDLYRTDLGGEAIRLTRMLHRALPGEGEVTGLLALMLLNDARRPARAGPDGSAIPIAEQDRGLWQKDLIAEGTALVTRAMTDTRLGPYQIQAAIAALHDEPLDTGDTDWPQILALYTLLEQFDDSPVVALNRAVATSMVLGPRAGLAELARLESDPRIAQHHRLLAVRAHLLEDAGRGAEALIAYQDAARLTLSVPERRYLQGRAARLRRGERPAG
ncbi:MAG: RNA polymerase sigma factor [Nocardioidaceae bacterium]